MQRLLRQTFFILINAMTFSQFYRFLESQGWTRGKGTNHYKYSSPDSRHWIPVGRHTSQEIGSWLLDKMLRETGLKKAFKQWKKNRT